MAMKKDGFENLGKLGRDKVTGFEGIITAKAKHLYGCDSYCLVARVKDNKADEKANGWYDEGRIEIIGEGVHAKSVKAPSGKGAGELPLPSCGGAL